LIALALPLNKFEFLFIFIWNNAQGEFIMTAIPIDFGFYAICTNPAAGYEKLAGACVDLCVPFIQLRMKDAPESLVARTAASMMRIIDGSESRFIINDYPQVAADVGAHGLHLGQDDMPFDLARTIVGPEAIIGLSTHSPQQTLSACALSPAYIGVGPVFPTPTKKIADPPIGIEGMKTMLAAATVSAVVLGAITIENLPEILGAGAKNFSMVRPVNSAEYPAVVIKKILDIVDDYRDRAEG
jgi:thiamine-phosphate pyrophosphorylase